MHQPRNRKRNDTGFTLVELVLVLILIAVFAGAILKGFEIYENSKIVTVASQLKKTQFAYQNFYDAYKYYPGDIPRNIFGACTTANKCVLGNGNGKVGTPYTGNIALNAKFYNDAETPQFWKHLALADMLVGVSEGSDPLTPQWGVTHPETILGGGLEVYYEAGNGIPGTPPLKGQLIRLSKHGLGLINTTDPTLTPIDSPGEAALSPAESAMIDRKIDDGNGLRGVIHVWDSGNHGCDNRLDGTEGFDETVREKSCVLYMKINK